jgi:hypothetical protein
MAQIGSSGVYFRLPVNRDLSEHNRGVVQSCAQNETRVENIQR